ncbi:DNA cytosine methyltransferase [Actinopolymorpha sp. B17G11]|uniref:DNA cytosine methyltransferase n=1 Tax=Actinopolymorpha sp. B17G11 TaxID=3160861 RepID=UPI0032E39A27
MSTITTPVRGRATKRHSLMQWVDELTMFDEFAGAGGSSQGAARVPGIHLVFAANHNKWAIASHQANFPDVDHFDQNVQDTDITRFPYAAFFWASPACPEWTDAKGKKRTFDKSNQTTIFDGEPVSAEDQRAMRSRALMEEVPRYLRHWVGRGRPVLAGVVENVIQCRQWDEWKRWIDDFHSMGYETRVIAFNSMHATAPKSKRAPQSRDRLYVAYWRKELARKPDWNKWLRPRAYCPTCDDTVNAMQVFKNPKNDMGRYRTQYVYRCPRVTCRHQVVEPGVEAALAAIDWSIPAETIGARAERGDPLAANTVGRVNAGIVKYAGPITAEVAGNTFERRPGVRTWPITSPITTQTTTRTKAIAFPPLLVPNEGRDGKLARPATLPARTMTTRRETGLAFLPFVDTARNHADGTAITEPVATVSAGGNHHFLCSPPIGAMVLRNNGSKGDGSEHCTPVTEEFRTMTTKGHQSLAVWQHLLVPYYSNGQAYPATDPFGALSTRDRYALASATLDIDINDVLYRMLEPHEIGAAMAFAEDYIILGTSKAIKTMQYGNAVTPPVAEIIVSALCEAITQQDYELAA